MTRYVIAAGTSDYGTDVLPFATRDADRVRRLFTQRFGYTEALTDLAHNPTTDALRRGFARWLRDRAADDVVVFYYAGHGDKSADGRHYLLCADSEFDALTSTALATDDLLRLWSDAGHPVDNLLVILDVCYAGAGVAQLEMVAKDLAAVRRRQDAEGIWVLAAARARDEAEESLFVDTLERAIDTAKAGQRAQYLAVDDVVDTINADLAERGRSQRAVCLPRFSRTIPPFLSNPKYWSDAPPEGVDLATQRKLRRLDLEQHFEPRSRGVERGTDLGSLFCGRTRVLDELTTWLNSGDGRARVVTGGPGAGKSAVLGKLVMDVDPDLAIHARQLRLDQVVAAFATELGVEADVDTVLRALRDRDRLVVVVDALDEAANPAAIARELLRPMSTIPAVRLLVGTRPEYVPHLRPAITELNLDLPEYTEPDDVAEYVSKILLAEEDPHQPTPYRDNTTLAKAVAEGVARRARNNFLVARMHALSLAYATEPVDTTEPGWQNALKSDIGAVFDEYLSRFAENADRVRRLLTPLAYAEGRGLPWDDIWAPLATVLSGVNCTDEDIAWLLRNANSYIVEATENDRSVYRLYHQALVDHLQHRLPGKETHRRIVNALRADDPFEAHPYVRGHLPQHAAAAGVVDQLITDPDFVMAAEQPALFFALSSVVTAEGELIAAVIERAMANWPDPSYLQFAARRYGADDFADRIKNLTWSTPWADVVPRTPHRVLASGKATALATTVMPGQGPVVIVGFDNGLLAVIDVETAGIASGITFNAGRVDGLAPVLLPDGQLVLLIAARGHFYRCDIARVTVTELPIPAEYKGSAEAVTTDGSKIGLLVQHDGVVHVYDVDSDRFVDHIPPPRGARGVNKVVAAMENGHTTLIVSHAFQEDMSALDLATGRWRTLHTPADRSSYRVLLTTSDLPHLLVTSDHFDNNVQDYVTGQFIGEFSIGTPLAVGTLADGQVMMVIESPSNGLGLWLANDVISSCNSVDQMSMLEGVTTTLDDPAFRTDRPAITLDELLELTHSAPDRLGLTGRVAMVVETQRSGNERVFATCLSDGAVQIWPAAEAPHGSTGKPVVPYATTSSVRTSGYNLSCWALSPARCRQWLTGHDGMVAHAAFTRRPDGRDVVITAGVDNTIRRWDIHVDQDPPNTPPVRTQSATAVDVWAEWVVHANQQGWIRARALADGRPANVPTRQLEDGVEHLHVSSGAVVDDAGNAHLWTWGQPLVPVLTDVSDLDAAITPDHGHLLVSVHHSGDLVVRRRVDDELVLVGCVARDQAHDHFSKIRTAVLPTGEVVAAVVDTTDVMQVWMVDSLELRGTTRILKWPDWLATGQLPDGRAVAIVPGPDSCVLVDLDTIEEIATLPTNDDLQTCRVGALNDGRHVAVGVTDRASPRLLVWDLYSMLLVTEITLPTRVRDLALAPDGIVALATDTGVITIKL